MKPALAIAIPILAQGAVPRRRALHGDCQLTGILVTVLGPEIATQMLLPSKATPR
jgi:hypothetical protein